MGPSLSNALASVLLIRTLPSKTCGGRRYRCVWSEVNFASTVKRAAIVQMRCGALSSCFWTSRYPKTAVHFARHAVGLGLVVSACREAMACGAALWSADTLGRQR